MVCVECIGEIVIMSYDACLLQVCKQDTSCCLRLMYVYYYSTYEKAVSGGGRWSKKIGVISNGTSLEHFVPNGTLTSQLFLIGLPLVNMRIIGSH